MGVGVGLVIAAGTAGVMWGTEHAPRAKPQETSVRGRELLALLRQARRFQVLLAAFVVQSTAIGTLLAGVDCLARVVLGEPGRRRRCSPRSSGPRGWSCRCCAGSRRGGVCSGRGRWPRCCSPPRSAASPSTRPPRS
ncbi:hypothetical protein ACOBQX_28085 [Actinokineospora sp. G85]|uniref:hypothetical protein n=1 Tax=Actinokineospora sp. G85 TaxID=3406626 RepID=UPI003C78E00D